MKKKRVCFVSVALAMVMLCSVFLSGCGLFGDGDDAPDVPVVYTIQYTDDAGTHTIEVEDGDPYAIESIPQREGYDFVGLFDAEVGGTQYVSANGSSLSPFTDGRNMVLFPQYKAKQYVLQLDFQGAAVTGDRNYTVTYGESLPELPKNLTLENRVFTGWYTEEDSGGTQVADENGLILDKAIVNSTNFDLSNPNGFIYLYAGFSIQQFIVTLNFGNGIQSQEINVDYNTPVSEIVPDVRNSEGEAVLSWSTSQSGGNLFTGNITGDTVLYAAEWAPVIELNSNGGEEVFPVVAREGASVALPTPTRANYRFMGWQDENGDIAQITTMPAGGASLTASWQAMLVFDENGGTEVSDISQPVGEAITLPAPEREGYIFAGWYTEDETKYEVTSMPVVGVALKAGWYKSELVTQTIIPSDNSLRLNGYWSPTSETYQILLTTFVPGLDVSVPMSIHVKLTFFTQHEVSDYNLEKFNPSISCTLSRSIAVSSNDTYLSRTFESNYLTAWQKREMEANITINNGLFYIIFRVFNADGDRTNANVYVSNFIIEITYPDTSTLYI